MCRSFGEGSCEHRPAAAERDGSACPRLLGRILDHDSKRCSSSTAPTHLLGEREPEVYGSATLADVEGMCRAACADAGLTLDFRQSNHEGQLIDWVQEGRRGIAGVVINAAGYTHTSVALRDALSAATVPSVEVHISDISAREEFRRHSYLTDVTDHQVIGHGVDGYVEAIWWIAGRDG